MVFKAVTQSIARDSVGDVKISREEDDNLATDELVMMLMPRVTFDAFREIGKEYDMNPSEVMSYALKELEKKIQEGKEVLDV